MWPSPLPPFAGVWSTTKLSTVTESVTDVVPEANSWLFDGEVIVSAGPETHPE